jgi:hypothetical protein
MGIRDELGAADVSDAQLAAMVADLLHEDEVELLDSRVDPVDYDLPAITTGGRWWVSGHATTQCAKAPYRFFVKQVQSWSRSPFFQFVPEHLQEWAASTVPWKTEAEVYRSDFGSLLPEGLSTPRSLGVYDLDDTSSAIWLEEVVSQPATWDRSRYERAAYLLGRFSGSRALAPLQDLRDIDWTLNTYVTGRLQVQVQPILMSDEVWQHPLCAAFDDELRERLRRTVVEGAALGAEADALPYLLSHGDACPNNLMAGEQDDELVMIDFGFWGGAPVGFDLTQLLVGDIQIGKRDADDLAELDEAIVASYVAGLRAEGCEIPEAQVWRGHALCLLIMTGLSTVPFDLFERPINDETFRIAADRAKLARYSLDLFEQTAGAPS